MDRSFAGNVGGGLQAEQRIGWAENIEEALRLTNETAPAMRSEGSQSKALQRPRRSRSARTLPTIHRDNMDGPSARFAQEVAKLRGFLRRRAVRRRGIDPDDLVQDTIEKALRKWQSFRPETNLRAWLTTILVNTHLDYVRRVSKQRESAPLWAEVPNPEPHVEPWWLELDIQSVIAAGRKIRPEFYEAWAMKELEGMSYRQIAQRTGVPLRTVGTRILRARQALLAILESEFGPDQGDDT